MTNKGCNISSKLPETGTTIFTVMSQLATQHGAINLSQGFPDFSCSGKLIDRVHHYMKQGMNQYAHMAGVPALREVIAAKTEKMYGKGYDPEKEITITSGATEALYAAIAAVVRPDDEVLLFDPAYDSYAPAVQLHGGIARHLQLEYPGYAINWEEVRKMITNRTRMIIINTPHNPTGAVLRENDLHELARIVQDSAIYILSDEVYEHIIFDGQQHYSMAVNEVLREKSFVVSSFGKTLHTTGWKLGYCLAPAGLTAEFRKVHQYLTFSTSTPMQHAIADYLQDTSVWEDLPAFYQEKRDYFLTLMEASRFEPVPSRGTYFQLLSYKNIAAEKDTEMAVKLTKEVGVAAIPVSVFYKEGVDNKVLRFCFAKENATLEQAAEKLCRI